jgi:hypothetical protein
MTSFPEGGVYHRLMDRSLLVPCLTTLSVPPSGDPSDKMWLMYLSESEKHDKDISDAWKDDANGVLVFVRISPSIYDPSLTNTL